MIRFDDSSRPYFAERLLPFVKKMVEDGIVPQQADMLALGYSYALTRGLKPLGKVKQQVFATNVLVIGPHMRLAFAATAPKAARDVGEEPPKDSKELLSFVCRLGSAGIEQLQKEWKDRSKSQMLQFIMKLVEDVQASPSASGESVAPS